MSKDKKIETRMLLMPNAIISSVGNMDLILKFLLTPVNTAWVYRGKNQNPESGYLR